MLKNGYVKVTAIVPNVNIADPKANALEIIKQITKANNKESSNIFVTPELSLTGYSCGDLFNQRQLYKELNWAIEEIVNFSKTSDFVSKLIVAGAPIRVDNQLFNCALYIQNGKILGVVPKVYIPNYNEFYEKRWFSSAINRKSDKVTILNQVVLFNENLLIKDTESELVIGTDICEDLWVPIPPSTLHCLNGANLILNLSASNNTATKSNYRKNLVSMQSAKNYCGYVYVSAGPSESTSDVVFSGHTLISECGSIIAENEFEESITTAVIDIEKIQNDRMKYNSFSMNGFSYEYNPVTVIFNTGTEENEKTIVNPFPFVPSLKKQRYDRCMEILSIQSQGLATRLIKTGIKKAVIGISGGLDSTLALLVIKEAFTKTNLPMKNIIGITMPCFGTSTRTLNNSLALMDNIGIDSRTISIKNACIQHLKDINHPQDVYDITYENVQARERTQVLMDIANQENGLVIGTGDLSELALGWCTYNGDHMSNYAVNVSIPKTLVKFLIQTIADNYKESNEELFKILYDIIDTPISPELLPLDENGEINQKTESSIGKYDLHDFFLYHYIRNGFDHDKILKLAYTAFKEIDKKEIAETFEVFIKRFTTQQFKRNCLPDGPKVGSVSLSPRGDWRMPADIIYRKK